MKKNFKAVLALLFAAVLAFNFVPANVKAAADANVAFLGIGAPADWSLSWWGTGDSGNSADPGVVGTDAIIDGPGQYTVGVDFTGTPDGKVNDVQFTAVMIQGFEAAHPGWIIQVDSIQINGADVEFGKGYTSCDADGKDQTRYNLYNQWAGTTPPADARTADGSLDGATATPLDITLLKDVATYSVTFTLIDPNAPAEDAAAEETATDDTAATDVPKTGVVDLGIVYGLGAIATGALALRRKQR